jgi:hypothetical protein
MNINLIVYLKCTLHKTLQINKSNRVKLAKRKCSVFPYASMFILLKHQELLVHSFFCKVKCRNNSKVHKIKYWFQLALLQEWPTEYISNFITNFWKASKTNSFSIASYPTQVGVTLDSCEVVNESLVEKTVD